MAEDLEVEDVGRPSWLFLHRPEGWEEELSAIEDERDNRRGAEKQAVEEQKAARRLREVEADLEKARAELADAQAAAAREREQKAAAAASEAALRASLEKAERARSDAEARVETSGSARSEAEAKLAQLREELADTKDALARAAVVDVDLVRRSLAEAAQALSTAAVAVEAALASVPPEAAEPRRPRGEAAPKRTPVQLPGGVLDDSPEAATHLVRVPGAVLLVDGYNATQWAWEGVPISEQRDRLIAAVCELHARTGIQVHVVFDGDGHDLTETAPTSGQPVRLTFTPAETEADDVIIERARTLPIATPVLVASNDNRVRTGCASAGANLLTVAQLMGLLKR